MAKFILKWAIFFYIAFSMEADIPDYDMDSEDEVWVNSQATRLELTPDKVIRLESKLVYFSWKHGNIN